MELNNFVINRIRRGTMFSNTNGEAMWSLTQITDPQLSVTTETSDAVDAVGTRIMQFDRSKQATLTGNNALLDFSLLAAQGGTEAKYADTNNKVTMPKWEEISLTAAQVTAGKIELSEVPVGETGAEIPFIYRMNGDSTLAEKYKIGSAADKETFVLDAANKTITLPTDTTALFKAGDTIWVPYEYSADAGTEVTNTAVDFPKAGKFVMEVLGCDVCDTTKVYYAYVVFPNAKLQGQFDLNFTTDGNHPFTIEAMQQYCDREKKLFSLLIPTDA